MTRFEKIILINLAINLVVWQAPALGQGGVKFDVQVSGSDSKSPADVKGKPQKGSKKAPVEPPPPSPPKEPTFLATGEFSSTKEKARDSAIRAAVEKLREHLAQEDPPVILKL